MLKEKIDNRTIAIIILIVLVVYLPAFFFTKHLAVLQLSRGMNPNDVLPVYNSDSVGYVNLADNLAKYGVFSHFPPANYQPETFRTPGFPAILAAWKVIFRSYTYFPFLQIILTASTAILIYFCGKRLFSKAVGILASLFFILDPNTIYFSMIILSEVSSVFFTVLAFYLMFGRTTKSGPWVLALAGVALGFSTLIRPISILLPVVYVFFYYVRGKWGESGNRLETKKLLLDIAVVLSCYVAVLVPWYARNFARTGVIGISSVTSFNLAVGNVPEFLSVRDGITADQARQKLYAEMDEATRKGMADLRYSSKVWSVAFKYIAADPVGYARLHLVKTLPVFLSSSFKTILVTYNNVVGKEVFHLSSANITTLLIKHDFRAVLSELKAYSATTAEQIILGFIAVSGLLAVFFVKGKKTETLLLLCVILYFALLTGPVANSRFRMPPSPFIFLSFAAVAMAIYGRFSKYLKGRNQVLNK